LVSQQVEGVVDLEEAVVVEVQASVLEMKHQTCLAILQVKARCLDTGVKAAWKKYPMPREMEGRVVHDFQSCQSVL
jgi:hypothetical protein